MSTSTRPRRAPVRLTSAPVLAGALVVLTLLALGPLMPVDEALHGFWARQFTPNWVIFLDSWPNAIAGQAVCLPVLAAVAVWFAYRHRTWHPLIIAVAAEAAFYVGIGGMKVLLARTATKADGTVAGFWQGGPIEYGWYGIAYPSGHAAEAVLIYGAVAYLVRTYADPDWRIVRRLNWVVGLITVNAVGVAYYLGFHWPTDLVAGVIAGGLLLRIIVDVDRALAAQRPVYGLHLYRYIPQRFRAPVPVASPDPAPAPAPSPVPQPQPQPHVLPSPAWMRAEVPAGRGRRRAQPSGRARRDHDRGLVGAEHREAHESRHLAS